MKHLRTILELECDCGATVAIVPAKVDLVYKGFSVSDGGRTSCPACKTYIYWNLTADVLADFPTCKQVKD